MKNFFNLHEDIGQKISELPISSELRLHENVYKLFIQFFGQTSRNTTGSSMQEISKEKILQLRHKIWLGKLAKN